MTTGSCPAPERSRPGWEAYLRVPEHHCPLPAVTHADSGRAWQCDGCGARYVYVVARQHDCSTTVWSTSTEHAHWCADA